MNQAQTAKVLVTGATGMVGRVLCQKLQAERRVYRAVLRRGGNFASDPLFANSPFLIDDLSPETDWSGAFKGLDTVVHLAARVHSMGRPSADDEDIYRQINIEATLNLAQAAIAQGVRRFIFMSTIKVHGEEPRLTREGGVVPFDEEVLGAAEGPYARSKWQAEQALKSLAATSGLELVIIRPPLVYGPSVRANFLALIRLVDRGWPLPFGRITNRRSFVYVGNLVDAIFACLEHPRAAGETFLVTDQYDVSTSELVQIVGRSLHRHVRLLPIPIALLEWVGRLLGRKEAIARLTGTLSARSDKIQRLLGWTPPFSMDHGIEETVRWYRQRESQGC